MQQFFSKGDQFHKQVANISSTINNEIGGTFYSHFLQGKTNDFFMQSLDSHYSSI